MIQIISQSSLKALPTPLKRQSLYACYFEMLPNPENRYLLHYVEKKTGQEGCASVYNQDEEWILDTLLVPYAFESGKLNFSPKRSGERQRFYDEIYQALINLSIQIQVDKFIIADQGDLNEELCQAGWPLFYVEENQNIYLDVSRASYNPYHIGHQFCNAWGAQ